MSVTAPSEALAAAPTVAVWLMFVLPLSVPSSIISRFWNLSGPTLPLISLLSRKHLPIIDVLFVADPETKKHACRCNVDTGLQGKYINLSSEEILIYYYLGVVQSRRILHTCWRCSILQIVFMCVDSSALHSFPGSNAGILITILTWVKGYLEKNKWFQVLKQI